MNGLCITRISHETVHHDQQKHMTDMFSWLFRQVLDSIADMLADLSWHKELPSLHKKMNSCKSLLQRLLRWGR